MGGESVEVFVLSQEGRGWNRGWLKEMDKIEPSFFLCFSGPSRCAMITQIPPHQRMAEGRKWIAADLQGTPLLCAQEDYYR